MRSSKTYDLRSINIILWILFISLLILIGSAYKKPVKDKDIIEWSQDYKLRITDFNQVDFIYGNIPANAATGMFMAYNRKKERYNVIAIFDRKRSGWNNKLIKNPDWILNHEQRHFDITQYVVTELNKELSICPFDMADELFYKYQYKLDSLQIKYDNETMHSMDSAYQVFWNKKIDYFLTN